MFLIVGCFKYLREKYKSDLTIKKGAKIVSDIFREVQGNKFNLDRFELAYIEKDKGKIERLEELNKHFMNNIRTGYYHLLS